MNIATTRITLALLLLVSSVAVNAQNYPDPTRFEAEIVALEAQDIQGMPPAGGIVLTGSSSIARWHRQALTALAPLSVIPRGFGGSVMHDLVYYLDRVALKYKPRAILIYEGDNDTGAESYGITKDMIMADLTTIISRVHAELPETRIYLMSVKPSILRQALWHKAVEVNDAYQALAATNPLVYYVDAASNMLQADGTVMTDIFVGDNLHLNELGNAIWGSTIRAALMPNEGRYEQAYKP